MEISGKLVDNLFTDNIESVPNRNGFGDGLLEAGKKNDKIVALTADLAESTRAQKFAEEFPERFIECGVAEQNMASVASGLAAMGKIPFIASYAMFSPGRSWEQVRTTIAYNNSNVKIIGAHAGVSVGPDGATHQAIEDMAIMRVMPNMIVIAPADANEAKQATLWAAEHKGPVYIRLARSATPVIMKEEATFDFPRAEMLITGEIQENNSVGIIVTGTLTYNALRAGVNLNKNGISASVLHVPTIKPLDTGAVEKLAKQVDFLVTVEEHQAAGGLGSAVAEHLSEVSPIKIIRLGVKDEFGQSGTPEELITHYGLDEASIVKKVKNIFSIQS